MLPDTFFDRDPQTVAKSLLGKVIRHKYNNDWLAARIIETEAYYLQEKGSHSSLGLTQSRAAMFMPAGTIYMYYARGADSLNVSCHGEGNAVLIKSGYPYFDDKSPKEKTLPVMQRLNPHKTKRQPREIQQLCNGQTLLCRSLHLRVVDWNQKHFKQDAFYIEDVDDNPKQIIQTTRLGIAKHRDTHLPYRFIDQAYHSYCTRKASCDHQHINA